MKNKLTLPHFAVAMVVALTFLIPYELYWKSQYWPKGHDLESQDLWATWRQKVKSLSIEDVVIVGSSRAHFDINIHVWDSLTGRRPIMLAFPGSSPLHPIEDIVRNTSFNGVLVIGVSPGLFFTMKGKWGANRGKSLVDYYYDRTYAQRLSGFIYQFIDPLFHYTQGSDLNLKGLIPRLPIPNRDSIDDETIWPPMVSMDQYRNIRMIPEMENDTSLQRIQKDIWFNPNPKNRLKDSVEVILDFYTDLVQEFKARGGKVAFIRPPVTGYYLDTEPLLFPRAAYWDPLIDQCACPGYHFQDDPISNSMQPPEWSHLSRQDADIYTQLIVSFLIRDKMI